MGRFSIAALACALISASVWAQETPPKLAVEHLATPVVTSRLFSHGLAPNARGGWTFVGQFMNFNYTNKPKHKVDLGDGRFYIAYSDLQLRPEAKWLVADLQSGTSKIVRWPGFHSPIPPVLAENGRLFFAVDYAHLYYYEPTEDTVKPMGCVKDNINQLRVFYRLVRGPDGMIYGSAQATNGLTTLIRLNPDTLEYRLYEEIGIPGRRPGLTYGYTLAVDPPWMYVAVGQGNWELFAVNAETGEKTCLADVQGDGCRVDVAQEKDLCTAHVTGSGVRRKLWLVDGKAYPAEEGKAPPGTPMSQKKYASVQWRRTAKMDIGPAPELDQARPVEVDAKGQGDIYWRPAGDKGEWRRVQFAIQNAEPVRIESLIGLPDGSILGNAESYNGFFRYYPKVGKLEYFGKHGPSQVRSVVLDGQVWFCGYPNVNLSVYDPTKPWTSKSCEPLRAGVPPVNPTFIGYFGQGTTEAHHCHFLLAPGNGRIYICGSRERWSTGTGLGYYEIATGRKFGLGQANKDINPVGCIALPKLNRIVLSGALLDKAGEARLILYDLDLNEIGRIQLAPDLKNTGPLFTVGSDSRFVGCYQDPASSKYMIYLYDLETGKVAKSAQIQFQVNQIVRRPEDGSWLAFAGKTVCRFDPVNLKLDVIGEAEENLKYPVWSDGALYAASGGKLLRVMLSDRSIRP